MGVKYYVSGNATDQQVSAVEKLIPSMFGYLKYSAPATIVEIERMKGCDGGPIKLTNISKHGFPAPAPLEDEQYKSVSLSYKGEDKNFNYAGTNGFIGKIDTNGTSNI